METSSETSSCDALQNPDFSLEEENLYLHADVAQTSPVICVRSATPSPVSSFDASKATLDNEVESMKNGDDGNSNAPIATATEKVRFLKKRNRNSISATDDRSLFAQYIPEEELSDENAEDNETKAGSIEEEDQFDLESIPSTPQTPTSIGPRTDSFTLTSKLAKSFSSTGLKLHRRYPVPSSSFSAQSSKSNFNIPSATPTSSFKTLNRFDSLWKSKHLAQSLPHLSRDRPSSFILWCDKESGGDSNVEKVLRAVESDHWVVTKPEDNKKRRTLVLARTKGQPFGFTLQTYGICNDLNSNRASQITYVDYVEMSSFADLAGLRAGKILM